MSELKALAVSRADCVCKWYDEETKKDAKASDLGYGSAAANRAFLKLLAVMHHSRCQTMGEMVVCTIQMLNMTSLKAMAAEHLRDPTLRVTPDTVAELSAMSLNDVYDQGVSALSVLTNEFTQFKEQERKISNGIKWSDEDLTLRFARIKAGELERQHKGPFVGRRMNRREQEEAAAELKRRNHAKRRDNAKRTKNERFEAATAAAKQRAVEEMARLKGGK
jgi:hypothetical protein